MANNWAIAVGINEYEFLPNASLRFAVNDALAMRSFLCEQAGFQRKQVLLCGDGEEPGTRKATRAVLRDILKHQLQRARGADNLWFFFSGHGMAGSNQDFLITTDGNPADLEETAIPLHFVTDQLRACHAKNVVLILDMCRDEVRSLGKKSTKSVGDGLQELVQQKEGQQGIVTLFSCGRGHSSFEIENLGQGAFTYALLEGLQRHTILKDLESYLASRVLALNDSETQSRNQILLVIPEPGWKYEEPLLSHYVTQFDVARLKEIAMDAQLDDNIKAAQSAWEKINLHSKKAEDRRRALRQLQRLSKLGEDDLGIAAQKIKPPTQKARIDYSHLATLLKTQDWKKADQETLEIMLRISNREFEGWLSSRSLKKIPCAELLEIDKLWSKYSAGKYGFTTQRQIWKDCDSPMAYCDDWLKFGTQVGWREQNGDKWHTRFEDLNINKSGVLPFEMHVAESARSLWSIVGWNDCGIWGVSHISLRLEECEL